MRVSLFFRRFCPPISDHTPFRRTVGRHGYKVEIVDEIPSGVTGSVDVDKRIVYLTNDVSQGTLIDEYAHVWNQTQGRGAFLEGTPKYQHLLLGDLAIDFGTANLTSEQNIVFHQLEPRNLCNSGGALPKFFNGVTVNDIRVFCGF